MDLEILLDGHSIVKVAIDLTTAIRTLQSGARAAVEVRSTPATPAQMRELLSRIDQRSAQFLRAIAMSGEGSVTWREMRPIFGIADRADWSAYSGAFGKGITRAYRHILSDKTAKLVCWDDDDWVDVDWDDDMCAVFVDGQALDALRLICSV